MFSVKNKNLLIIIAAGLLFCMLINPVVATTLSGKVISNNATLYASGGAYSTSSNTVQTSTGTIYGIDINENSSQSVLPSQKAYFPKTLTNVDPVIHVKGHSNF